MVTYTQANGDKYKYCKAHCADADSDGGLCADTLVPGNLSSAHEGEHWQKQNADNNSAEKPAGADAKVLTGLPGNLSPIS